MPPPAPPPPPAKPSGRATSSEAPFGALPWVNPLAACSVLAIPLAAVAAPAATSTAVGIKAKAGGICSLLLFSCYYRILNRSVELSSRKHRNLPLLVKKTVRIVPVTGHYRAYGRFQTKLQASAIGHSMTLPQR